MNDRYALRFPPITPLRVTVAEGTVTHDRYVTVRNSQSCSQWKAGSGTRPFAPGTLTCVFCLALGLHLSRRGRAATVIVRESWRVSRCPCGLSNNKFAACAQSVTSTDGPDWALAFVPAECRREQPPTS